MSGPILALRPSSLVPQARPDGFPVMLFQSATFGAPLQASATFQMAQLNGAVLSTPFSSRTVAPVMDQRYVFHFQWTANIVCDYFDVVDAMACLKGPDHCAYLTMTMKHYSLTMVHALHNYGRHFRATIYVCLMYHRAPMLPKLL